MCFILYMVFVCDIKTQYIYVLYTLFIFPEKNAVKLRSVDTTMDMPFPYTNDLAYTTNLSIFLLAYCEGFYSLLTHKTYLNDTATIFREVYNFAIIITYSRLSFRNSSSPRIMAKSLARSSNSLRFTGRGISFTRLFSSSKSVNRFSTVLSIEY